MMGGGGMGGEGGGGRRDGMGGAMVRIPPFPGRGASAGVGGYDGGQGGGGGLQVATGGDPRDTPGAYFGDQSAAGSGPLALEGALGSLDIVALHSLRDRLRRVGEGEEGDAGTSHGSKLGATVGIGQRLEQVRQYLIASNCRARLSSLSPSSPPRPLHSSRVLEG